MGNAGFCPSTVLLERPDMKLSTKHQAKANVKHKGLKGLKPQICTCALEVSQPKALK